MISKFKEEAKNRVDLHMALFRLPQFLTDILVTLNNPVEVNAQSSSFEPATSSAKGWAMEDFQKFACSLKLLDPTLFG